MFLINIVILIDRFLIDRYSRNGGTLKFVPDCYKKQKMFYKAVDNYLHAVEFVPDFYNTQKMCKKAVDVYTSAIQFVPKC